MSLYLFISNKHPQASPPALVHSHFNRLLDLVQIMSFYCRCTYILCICSSTLNDRFVAKCAVFNSIHYIERCSALNQHITSARFEIETKPSSYRLNACGRRWVQRSNTPVRTCQMGKFVLLLFDSIAPKWITEDIADGDSSIEKVESRVCFHYRQWVMFCVHFVWFKITNSPLIQFVG